MASRIWNRIENRSNRQAALSKVQLERAMISCKQGIDSAGLNVKEIDEYIGSGVFAERDFKKGEYLLEYQGDLISYREAMRREKILDATNSIFSMGRMVNDAAPGDPKENAGMKIIVVDKLPHLCLFATRDIVKGEELRYDYGVPNLPWRQKCAKEAMTFKADDTKVSEKTRAPQNQLVLSETPVQEPALNGLKQAGDTLRQATNTNGRDEDNHTLCKDGMAQAGDLKRRKEVRRPIKYKEDSLQQDGNALDHGVDRQSKAVNTVKKYKEALGHVGDTLWPCEDTLEQAKTIKPEAKYTLGQEENTQRKTVDTLGQTEDELVQDEDQLVEVGDKHGQNEDLDQAKDLMEKSGDILGQTKDKLNQPKDTLVKAYDMIEQTKDVLMHNVNTLMGKRVYPKVSHICTRAIWDALGMCDENRRQAGDTIGKSKDTLEDVFTIATDLQMRCESQSDHTNTTVEKLQGGNVNEKRSAHTNQRMIHKEGSHSGQDIYRMHLHINKNTYTARDKKNERSHARTINNKNVQHQHYEELWSESEDDESLVYSDSEYEPSDDEQYVSDSQSTDSCDSDIIPNHLKLNSLKLEDSPKLKPPKKLKANQNTSLNEMKSNEMSDSDTAGHIKKQITEKEIGSYVAKSIKNKVVSSIGSGQIVNDVAPPTVPKTNNAGQRSYDKKFFCLYCNKSQTKLPRHLVSQHADETDVIEYVMEKDQRKKKVLLDKLRNIGNHIHNCDVLKKGEGELAVRYRPTLENSKVDDYGPCPYCFGYFVRRELWRHNCPFKPSNEKGRRHMMATSSSLLLPCTSGASVNLGTVMASLKQDDISRIAKSDDIILAFGERLCCRHGHDKEQYNYIRQKLREMGRLVKELRKTENKPDKSLKDFIDPKYFRAVVESSKAISLFDIHSNRYGTPSLALKLGQSLQKCAKIIVSQAIENQDKDLQAKGEEFMKLLEINWTEEIASNALKTLHEGKRNSSHKMLPLADDVKSLTDYLKKMAEETHESLISSTEKEAVKQYWVELSEILLAQTILFNRRRAGEVSKMTIEEYTNTHKADIDGPIKDSLTELERKLCKTLTRVETGGKRGRTVPVLFNTQTTKYLDSLNERRSLVVRGSNQFLFPRAACGNSHLRGTDCLRKFAARCGAKQPEKLTSTKLRKQIATMSQLINMKDNELDILANFLGHDIRVHREYYRLPEATIQVAKVSKLLLRMEKGGKGLGPGQSLDSVNLEEENESEVDDADDDELEEESESEEEKNDNEEQYGESNEKEHQSTKRMQEGEGKNPIKKIKIRLHPQKGRKRTWVKEEQDAVLKHLSKFILMKRIPGKRDIDNCIAKEPALSRRSWKNVKDFCRNRILSTHRK